MKAETRNSVILYSEGDPSYKSNQQSGWRIEIKKVYELWEDLVEDYRCCLYHSIISYCLLFNEIIELVEHQKRAYVGKDVQLITPTAPAALASAFLSPWTQVPRCTNAILPATAAGKSVALHPKLGTYTS